MIGETRGLRAPRPLWNGAWLCAFGIVLFFLAGLFKLAVSGGSAAVSSSLDSGLFPSILALPARLFGAPAAAILLLGLGGAAGLRFLGRPIGEARRKMLSVAMLVLGLGGFAGAVEALSDPDPLGSFWAGTVGTDLSQGLGVAGAIPGLIVSAAVLAFALLLSSTSFLGLPRRASGFRPLDNAADPDNTGSPIRDALGTPASTALLPGSAADVEVLPGIGIESSTDADPQPSTPRWTFESPAAAPVLDLTPPPEISTVLPETAPGSAVAETTGGEPESLPADAGPVSPLAGGPETGPESASDGQVSGRAKEFEDVDITFSVGASLMTADPGFEPPPADIEAAAMDATAAALPEEAASALIEIEQGLFDAGPSDSLAFEAGRPPRRADSEEEEEEEEDFEPDEEEDDEDEEDEDDIDWMEEDEEDEEEDDDVDEDEEEEAEEELRPAIDDHAAASAGPAAPRPSLEAYAAAAEETAGAPDISPRRIFRSPSREPDWAVWDDARPVPAARTGPSESSAPAAGFEEAVEIVLGEGVCSASLLMRTLGLTHARAQAIIDRMEIENLVSPPRTTGQRDVLIDARTWASRRNP